MPPNVRAVVVRVALKLIGAIGPAQERDEDQERSMLIVMAGGPQSALGEDPFGRRRQGYLHAEKFRLGPKNRPRPDHTVLK
jgi:hypothetical protein